MQKLIIFIITLLLSFETYSQSEKYKILYINTKTINIGGKELGIGSEFNDSETINWTSPKQAIRIISLQSQRQLTLTGDEMGSHKKTLYSYVVQKHNLATRTGVATSIIGVSQMIPDTIRLLDRFEIKTTVPIDSKRFFYLSYKKGDEVINKKLNVIQEGGFYIDRTIWHIDNIPFTPTEILTSIYYYDTAAQSIMTVAENIIISPLIEKL